VQGSLLVWKEKDSRGYYVGENQGAHNGYFYYRWGNGVAKVLGHWQSRCWWGSGGERSQSHDNEAEERKR
jgi:hypothetical protein